MRGSIGRWGSAAAMLWLAACSAGPDGAMPGDAEDSKPFGAIGTDETVHLTGTEPFWGGEVAGGEFLYRTPDNSDGVRIAMERFAGRAGVAWSGRLEDRAIDLAVTAGECSDGMSDRSYPFVATLKLGDEVRGGCAWTDASPFTGPAAP